MHKILSVVLLVACFSFSRCDDEPAADLAVPGAKPGCSCILPVILLPGGGALPLPPGGLSISILNDLLGGGVLNNANLSILKIILSNPSLLNNPNVIVLLQNILGGGAAGNAGAPNTSGLLNNALAGGILNTGTAGNPASGSTSGIANNLLSGGVGNNLLAALLAGNPKLLSDNSLLSSSANNPGYPNTFYA